jgi:F0F1-type ATP synthase membrane subunit b/b'
MKSIEIIEDLIRHVKEARSVPLSKDGALVNRNEVIELLQKLRADLPDDVQVANEILDAKESVIDEGRRAAEALIEKAKDQARRLISEHSVLAQAQREAQGLLQMAENEVEKMRLETNKYIDARLANFEVALHKTLIAVKRGRDKMNGQSQADD